MEKNYLGAPIRIPDGYNYVATDKGGDVYAYVECPRWNTKKEEWNTDGAWVFIEDRNEFGEPSCGFDRSLCVVEDDYVLHFHPDLMFKEAPQSVSKLPKEAPQSPREHPEGRMIKPNNLYLGLEIEVPEGTGFVAMDASGDVYAFPSCPAWNEKTQEWFCEGGHVFIIGTKEKPPCAYKNTLRVFKHGRLTPVYEEPMNNIQTTLDERGKRYGEFKSHARITQDLKNVMNQTPKWDTLSESQREALEMIAHKIGRILNGDPNYADSWVDIAGYAQLVVNELGGGA